jgi:phenylacetate-CoA ligase
MRYVPNQIIRLYENSPIWTHNIASTAYGILKNRKERTKLFYQCLTELEETQWWSLGKLQELQSQRLKKLIKHCAEHVPYYQKKFAEYGIIPSQIQTPDDLKKLPILDKETIRQNFDDFISSDFNPKKLRSQSTGGTTGKPLTVLMNEEVYFYQKAIQTLHRSWGNFKYGEDWLGVLAGYKVVPVSRKTPPFWIINYYGKQIHFSSYHLNYDFLSFYVKKIKEMKIKYLMGYASAIGFLANYVNSIGEYIPLEAVFLSSEPLLDWQKNAIKKAFNCKIFDYYGQAECVISAINCDKSDSLHQNMEVGLLELGNINSGNSKHRIIGTSLVNFSFPIIRYDLGDVTSSIIYQCECGREHIKIQPIETRVEDFIITPNGSTIPAPALTLPYHNINGIILSQIIQRKVDTILVKVVKDNRFNNREKEKFISKFKECVGENMKINIEEVGEIPRTKNGKFRFVISEIKYPESNYI